MPIGPDDRPPYTIITALLKAADGRLTVRGTAADNGEIIRVVVNGKEARPLAPNFLEWEVAVEASPSGTVTARAADAMGNVEAEPHVASVP